MNERRGERTAKQQINAVLLIFAALSAIGLIVHDLRARRHGPAFYAAAQAIAGGYENGEQALDLTARRRLRPLSADRDAQDDQLRADELDAGAMWARVHRAKAIVDCPTESRVFYAGCVAAMRGEWPSE